MTEEIYELILGHNPQKEYFVKIVGQPYCRCKWISREALLSQQNGEEMLNRYLHNTSNQKTAPPFYNEYYDIPDRIILKKDNLLLVKWCHLFHDNLTWEDRNDKNYTNLYRIRRQCQYPKRTNPNLSSLTSYSFLPIRKFILYQDEIMSLEIVEQVQFYFMAFPHGDVELTEDFGKRTSQAVTAFLHALARKAGETGPYIVIVDPKEFHEWYDLFSRSRDLVPLSYNGSLKSREIIRELDFILADDVLSFNILITIPTILESDFEYISKIQWRFAFFHTSLADLEKYKTLFRNLDVFRRFFYFQMDPKESILKAQVISNALEAEPFKQKIEPGTAEKFQLLLQRYKIQPSGKIESPYFYIVECSLNDIQKQVCKMLLFDGLTIDQPVMHRFFVVARLFYFVMQHPFIFPDIEKKISCKDIRKCSTKMRVLNRILINAKKENEGPSSDLRVVICTEIPEMSNILNDFVSTYFTEGCEIFVCLGKKIKVPFKTVDYAILYDGKLSEWRTFMDPQISQTTRIYKLEVLDNCEIEIKNFPQKTDENVCKTISLQLMMPSGRLKSNDIINEALSFDMIYNDIHYSSLFQKYDVCENFWQTLLKVLAENGPQNENENNTPKNYINEFTNLSIHQRRQFLRAFSAFGWGRWEKLIRNCGFSMTEEFCKDLCASTISHLKSPNNFAAETMRDYLVHSVCSKASFNINFSSIYPNSNDNNNDDDTESGHESKVSSCPRRQLNLKKKNKNNLNSENSYDDSDDSENNDDKNDDDKKDVDYVDNSQDDNNNIKNELNNSFGNKNNCNKEKKDEMIVNFNDADEAAIDFKNINFVKDLKINTELKDYEFLLERILQLHCLDYLHQKSNEKEINTLDFEALSPKPESWWTNDHDRALLYAIHRYGYGNYPLYFKDVKNQYLREIVSSPLTFKQLSKRSLQLIRFITSYVINDRRALKNNFVQNIPNWTDKQQQCVITYVLRFGLNDNYLQEKLINNNNIIVDKTHKEIKEIMEIIHKESIRPNIGAGFSFIVALRIRMRIYAMHIIQTLLQNVDVKKQFFFFSHIPKWMVCGYQISSELEFLLYSEIESTGFGKLGSILLNPKFSRITDPKVSAFMKDEYNIILRICVVFEYAQKQNLFSNEPNNNDCEFTKQFSLQLPIMLTSTNFIHSFGKVVDKPQFHNERYIYPLGFRSSKLAPSLSNPNYKVRWFSEIADTSGGDCPVFRVWQDGVENLVFEGATPTAAWSHALRTCSQNKNISISGPDAFLLTSPVTVYFIQKLPGANQIKDYVFRDLDSNPVVIQFLKQFIQSSSNEERET